MISSMRFLSEFRSSDPERDTISGCWSFPGGCIGVITSSTPPTLWGYPPLLGEERDPDGVAAEDGMSAVCIPAVSKLGPTIGLGPQKDVSILQVGEEEPLPKVLVVEVDEIESFLERPSKSVGLVDDGVVPLLPESRKSVVLASIIRKLYFSKGPPGF